MSNKNNNVVENIGCLSQLGPDQIARDIHDFPGHSIRVRDAVSEMPQHYTKLQAEYNSENKPTKVSYFSGTASHKIEVGCLADVAGSLNNTYFIMYDGAKVKYHVWFNVDATGVDPNPADSIAIEVPIVSNDSANMIALAIGLIVNTSFSSVFTTTRTNAVVNITAVEMSITNDTVDFDTGFVISNTAGEECLTNVVTITYDASGNPILDGQSLIGYTYDMYSGKFVIDNKPESSTYTTAVNDLITVTTTATLLVAGLAGRRTIVFQPKGKTIWYWFDNTVSSGNSGNSFKLTSNSIVEITIDDGVEVYAVTSSGSGKVSVSEMK